MACFYSRICYDQICCLYYHQLLQKNRKVLIYWCLFQDNLGELTAERQSIQYSNKARDDGVAVASCWIICKIFAHHDRRPHQHLTANFCRPDAPPDCEPAVLKQLLAVQKVLDFLPFLSEHWSTRFLHSCNGWRLSLLLSTLQKGV